MDPSQMPLDRLSEAFDRLSRWSKNFQGPLWIAVVALMLFFTSFFQVNPDEVGVITRFGRLSRIAQPGLHLKWPLWIEAVSRVPIQRQLKEEFGFRTVIPGVRTHYERSRDSTAESTMLTGDLNVANVEWIVQYKVKDPIKYLFRVRHVTETFRDMAEASMREIVGDRSVTEVITVGREDIQIKAKEHLQDLCDRYQIGIEVLQLVLQDVNPPEPVRDSFNEVNQAIQEKERAINQAWANYNRVIPEAKGRAEQELESAQGYATARLNRAKGDAELFVAVQKEYARAKKVTRDRLYLETMSEVIPKARRRLIVDNQLKGLIPLLRLGEGG